MEKIKLWCQNIEMQATYKNKKGNKHLKYAGHLLSYIVNAKHCYNTHK